MNYGNTYQIDTNVLNTNNNNICDVCKIKKGEIVCKDCSPVTIFCHSCNESIHQLPSKQNHNQRFNINDNNNNENIDKNQFNQDICSNRFNNKNNISNLESTFSQTFRSNRYEPLSYCPSQDYIFNNNNNNNLNSTSSSRMYKTSNTFYNKPNQDRYEKCLTYYNYSKNKNNDEFNNIINDKKNDDNSNNSNINKDEEETNEGIIGKSPVTSNYIDKMRKIYETEQNNIRLQQYQLQKELNRTMDNNERRINYLNNTINDLKSRNENNIKNLIKENEYELKKVLDKKEQEINMLSYRNFELEKANNDLIEQLNNISGKINKDNSDNKEKISYYEIEIDNMSKCNNDLKNFYEKKLEYITRILSEEKNKLIAAYESQIDQINLEYNNAKKEYINQAQNKDNKLRNIINGYNSDTNILNKEINNLNEEIIKLKDDEKILSKKNNEIKRDNDMLRENYESAKKDLQYQIKQKELMEQSLASTQKEFYKLKEENEKLNRLTYGTFKRSKSKKV